MRSIRHSTAWLAGLAYLLASSLSGLLHSHSHQNEAAIAHCTEAHAHHSPHDDAFGAHHEPANSHDHPSSLPTSPADDDCLACRFVTQSAVVTAPPPEPTQALVAAELRVFVPRFFIEPVHTNRLARAPPLG